MELVMAKSLAGHDRDEIYISLGCDGERYVLVNGRNRTMERPKAKNKKHVQPIYHFPGEVREMAEQTEKWTDDNVRNIIRRYLDCQRQM